MIYKYCKFKYVNASIKRQWVEMRKGIIRKHIFYNILPQSRYLFVLLVPKLLKPRKPFYAKNREMTFHRQAKRWPRLDSLSPVDSYVAGDGWDDHFRNIKTTLSQFDRPVPESCLKSCCFNRRIILLYYNENWYYLNKIQRGKWQPAKLSHRVWVYPRNAFTAWHCWSVPWFNYQSLLSNFFIEKQKYILPSRVFCFAPFFWPTPAPLYKPITNTRVKTNKPPLLSLPPILPAPGELFDIKVCLKQLSGQKRSPARPEGGKQEVRTRKKIFSV